MQMLWGIKHYIHIFLSFMIVISYNTSYHVPPDQLGLVRSRVVGPADQDSRREVSTDKEARLASAVEPVGLNACIAKIAQDSRKSKRCCSVGH